MAKRWTETEDMFLVEFFEVIGPEIGPHDLGRSLASTKARVKRLKEVGAWEAYRASLYHRARALGLAGHTVGELQSDLVLEQMTKNQPKIYAAT